MKKILLLGLPLCMALAVVSCKPKQSAYKAAYEKAKATETVPTEVQNEPPVEESRPLPIMKQKPEADYSVATRVESIQAVAGEDASRLKTFSVVIGSFTVKTNAYSLKERMQNEGYNAVLGENEQGMLRVIVSSFDTKEEAVDGRDVFKARHSYNSEFQDSWILERKM